MAWAWFVCAALLLAGCSGPSSPASGPEDPVAGPYDPGAGASGKADDASEPPPLRLAGCTGAAVAFLFDAAAARGAVPEPFVPIISVRGPTEGVGAFGVLEHRCCDAVLEGEDLGRVAFALGAAAVEAPPSLRNGTQAQYIMRFATDSPALDRYWRSLGLPSDTVTPVDQSVWAADGIGWLDSTIQGDRMLSGVADSPLISTGLGSKQLFHRDGDNITRWRFASQGAQGDIAESMLVLDEALWGMRASPNLYFSSYLAHEALVDHEVLYFEVP